MMKKQKRKIIGLVAMMILMSSTSLATPLGFSGGVQNEHIYEEIVFLTGEPIKFSGTFNVSERIKDDEETVTYKFSLNRLDGEEGSLDRTMTYKTDLATHEGTGQKIGTTEVSKFRESIRIGEESFTLTDYQFSKSDVLDERPASDFYAGNIKGRKYYDYNSGSGTVVVDSTGGNVGYENFWGRTETQILDHTITRTINGSEEESWQGTYSNQVSDSLTRALRYSENDANFSSFHGGYIKVTNGSIVSKYDYRLPNKTGTRSLNQEIMPKIERLIVPKFRDVNGHWAEDNIKKLYSLDVFQDDSDIFSPDTSMTRLSFAKAIMRASDIRPTMEEKKPSRRKRNEPEEESYFKDIDIKHVDYSYVKGAADKKIMFGISKDLFGPKNGLKRSEAITILVRALGFENKAPNPGYVTSFADDGRIPSWARDSIYIARELDLVSGDSSNRVNPNEVLTRAEASTLIVRFLEFLEKDLQKDYRDNIIKF